MDDSTNRQELDEQSYPRKSIWELLYNKQNQPEDPAEPNIQQTEGPEPVDLAVLPASGLCGQQPDDLLKISKPDAPDCTSPSSEASREPSDTKLDSKLAKQIVELAKVLQEQTLLLREQQKLLEQLVSRKEKKPEKRKGIAKKIKNLISKSKILFAAL